MISSIHISAAVVYGFVNYIRATGDKSILSGGGMEYPASAGGAWIAAVNGFAGITERDGELVREPSLPDRWKEMSFKIMFRNILYMIEIKDGIGAMTEL